MRSLLAQGVEIDYFSGVSPARVNEILGTWPNLQYVYVPEWWQYGRWYSNRRALAFPSSLYARAQHHRKLCDLVAEQHKARRYDVVMQFSQMELLRLGKYLNELPPVVVYTCVHAAGELTWHRRESGYARQAESSIVHYVARAMLKYRSRVQRRESHKPAMLIGMSKRFNELMEQDYGVPANTMRVLYHPIDPAVAFEPTLLQGRKVRLVFAGRISVRKGVEMVVELSRRLDDLADQVEIEVIGGYTQWSDYRKHMNELNPRTAKYLGSQGADQLMDTFSRSDILITPSHYEPGGIVVGEAVERGMCVVASDEVGSAEPLTGPFVAKFPAGDMDAFEKAVREMLKRVQADRSGLASAAHAAAKQFDPPKIGRQLIELLEEAARMRKSPVPLGAK